MKRIIVLPALFAAALALATVASADKGKKQPHPNKATVVVHANDTGCAGNAWAADTLKRTIKVHLNDDSSYRVRIEDKGTFVTNAGTSPGNCAANTSRHGHTIRAGVQGTVKGYSTGTVTSGTFNPNATCTANPCTMAAFVTAFFGSSAQFSCLATSSSGCKFKYDYHAKKDQSLLFRHYQTHGTGAGTLLSKKLKGDIADA